MLGAVSHTHVGAPQHDRPLHMAGDDGSPANGRPLRESTVPAPRSARLHLCVPLPI